jgi:hypothetical protein
VGSGDLDGLNDCEHLLSEYCRKPPIIDCIAHAIERKERACNIFVIKGDIDNAKMILLSFHTLSVRCIERGAEAGLRLGSDAIFTLDDRNA